MTKGASGSENSKRNPATISYIVLISGLGICYLIWKFIHSGQDFSSYISGNLLWLWFVPFLIIFFVLRDNLSNYGMKMPENPKLVWSVTALLGIVTILGSYLPALKVVALQDYYPIFKHFRDAEQIFFAANPFAVDMGKMLFSEAIYAMYIFSWEFFFRGYLTLGLARKFGLWGVIIQTIPFVLLHLSKPTLEVALSAIGGLLLGLSSYYCKSFLPAFVLHVCLFISVDVWVSLVK